MNIGEKQKELHAELVSLKEQSKHLAEENERLTQKFLQVHQQWDKLHKKEENEER